MARKKNKIREDGRIAIQIYLGLDENGKRKYKTVYGRTQADADKKAAQVKLSMSKGIDVTADKDTFEFWAMQWLESKKREVSNGQYVNYKGTMKHLVSALGSAQISKIMPIDIQRIIDKLSEFNPNTKKPASKQTLKNVRLIALQIYQLAINNRVLEYNPANAVKIPINAPKEERRALTDTEQQWIVNTEHRAKRAAMIMMYAGLRRGEVVALTWSDINLDDRTISINKTAEKSGNNFLVKNTAKSKSGIRVIDIPQILAYYLQSEVRDSIHVCVNAQGRMHTVSSWTRMWDSYLFELNMQHGEFTLFQNKPKSKYDPKGIPFVIDKITPHYLRHTFATMLYFAGVDVLTAKDQLGHADAATTLGIYTHLDKTHKRKSMLKLDDFLKSASSVQVV